ncbi:hypothetical protein TIFTF001_040891 [Ficus carica]|uniref:Uncharacterized protein n=1 Tax=Ficus carica TaxID=3494 RepID=A0AA87ZMA9_FICCA|nr:hypothetical protein TIFTF001_040891 [Ficus carica]
MGLRKRRFNPLPTVGNVLPAGDIKIHVDAAVKQHLNYVGIGVVMRDEEAREGSSLATSLGYNSGNVCYAPEKGVASFALSQDKNSVWYDSVPKFLGTLIRADLLPPV